MCENAKCSLARRRIRLTAALLILLSAASVSSGANRIVFVTSVSGTGDLGSWPDAGIATGTPAGDAICQARATVAGLANPSNFIAWLSDSSDDAYCRLHNFSGTKSANCGESTLPVAAGPWLRIDGFPFGEAIDHLMDPNGVVYSALQFDEFGSAIPAYATFFTATHPDGTLATSETTCGDWTSNSSQITVGGSEARTTAGWTNSGGNDCSLASHLICLETLAGPALPPFAVVGRVAFVTSVIGNGELGSWPDAGGVVGIAAGDAICQARATAAGLGDPSSFKAWLSDGFIDAIDRFANDGLWVRPDGVTIAQNKADLTDGVLFAPINVNEMGDYMSNWVVWTGTVSSGTTSGIDCGDWTVGFSGTDGSYGPSNTFRGWTQSSIVSCNFASARLYCLSDTDLLQIFADDFESGDTLAWSVTVP
jgi:hypothetical protein